MKPTGNSLIRAANLTDAEAIYGLTRQLGYDLPFASVSDNLRRILDDENRVILVLIEAGVVVGMLTACRDFAITEPPYVLLTAIVVDERLRGQGYGRKLLEGAYSWATNHGIAKIRLRANLIRKEAHEFYVRNGFQALKDQRVFVKELEIPTSRVGS